MLLRKRQKVSKCYILVFRQKLENRSLHGENDFFKIFEKNVPIGLVLVHMGISIPFKHKKRRKNFLESLKSVTCSRFHQDMFAANDNMSNELLKNDT